jgi:hypothetical protein
MGYNSVVFICNDAWGEIDKDPAGWWAKTRQELVSHECMSGETKEYGFGCYGNGFWAVWNQHADYGALIAVGGNWAQVISSMYGCWQHNDPDVQLELLGKAADRLGYKLIRKPQKKENK